MDKLISVLSYTKDIIQYLKNHAKDVEGDSSVEGDVGGDGNVGVEGVEGVGGVEGVEGDIQEIEETEGRNVESIS
jgi:hypothetical protein